MPLGNKSPTRKFTEKTQQSQSQNRRQNTSNIE